MHTPFYPAIPLLEIHSTDILIYMQNDTNVKLFTAALFARAKMKITKKGNQLKFTETESRTMVAKGWGRGNCCLISIVIPPYLQQIGSKSP